MATERGRGPSRHPHPHGHPQPHPHEYPHHPRDAPQPHGHPHVYRKPLGEKIKDCCRSTIAFVFSNVGVCGLMVGYTIMGAFLFSHIEKEEEEDGTEVVIDADDLRNKTIERLWNVTVALNVLDEGNWRSNVTGIVKYYQKEVVDLVGNGWTGETTTIKSKWSIEGGFLYSLTVITTIGYGHISPNTQLGKVMTIVYTMFGMPVFLLYMANMGDILAKSLKWTYAKICICRRPAPRYDPSVAWRSADVALRAPVGGEEVASIESWNAEGEPERTDVANVNIPITVSLVIMVALLYGGTLLFEKYEDWDPLTAFYFCFISLTTIGFGDYVPGLSTTAPDAEGDEAVKDTSFIYCSLYLMFGLALLSMCFNLMQEEVVHKITACLNAVRFFKRRDGD
ncbi:potassium channel subfamily K member 16-like [Scylla paramamosain]|uniref:potassium channel subfamily K member 16-like n=1 Tax=Scylla paramamosain TaxID=85552 RepID=UPI003082D274